MDRGGLRTISIVFVLTVAVGGHGQVTFAAVSPLAAAPVAAAVSKCRKIADDKERLACYDAAAGAFDQAQAEGQVVIIDREQAKAVRRQAFGFNFPAINFLPRPAKTEAEDRVSVELAGAHTDSEGKWVMTTTEDAVWRQSDSNPLSNEPRRGSTMLIRKGLLGSFFCKVDRQSAIRCVRER